MGGACGKVGEACCAGDVGCTAPFSTCGNNLCVACGGLGETCCDGGNNGRFCGEPFVCNRDMNRCVQCGAAGQACCAGAV